MRFFAYTIMTGDTLWSLARRYNTFVEEIMFYNPEITDADRIYVGQTIVIPAQKINLIKFILFKNLIKFIC